MSKNSAFLNHTAKEKACKQNPKTDVIFHFVTATALFLQGSHYQPVVYVVAILSTSQVNLTLTTRPHEANVRLTSTRP